MYLCLIFSPIHGNYSSLESLVSFALTVSHLLSQISIKMLFWRTTFRMLNNMFGKLLLTFALDYLQFRSSTVN